MSGSSGIGTHGVPRDTSPYLSVADGQNVFACMLGGEDGRTLLLCVAPGLVDNDRLGGLAATLQTTRVDVPHAGRP